MEKFYNKHHILPKSQGGTNVKENLVKLDTRVHQALHLMFANGTPAEQIARILSISSTALTNEVKSDIIKILDVKDLDYWFKKWIYKTN